MDGDTHMRLKSTIKAIPLLRKIGKKINIFRAFKNDAVDFSKYYIEEAVNKGDAKYSIMLLVHSLEKGMCMPNPRPFGFGKVNELMKLLKNCADKNCFEYNLGLSALSAWKNFFCNHGWQSEKYYKEVGSFLENKKVLFEAGAKKYTPVVDTADAEIYKKIIFSRHSVRDFKEEPIKDDDLLFPIRAFAETPTACNRQMCRLLYVKNAEIKNELNNVIIGLPGFNKNHINYFIVTYDLAAFAYSGERQQGLFNAGLCTMSFVNALHVSGIGSCCLQWSNKYPEDQKVRRLLGLKDSERIGVVIGAGYYLDENIIPCSVRREDSDIYRKI